MSDDTWILAGALGLGGWLAYAGFRKRSRRGAVAREPFPPGLRVKLAKRYPDYHPGQIDMMLRGLRDWFEVNALADRRYVSMPSRAVDEAWHEFILFTRQYDQYCRRVFGRFLHHVPAEAMQSQHVAQEGVRRTWRLACARERIDPHRPKRLPRLFAIDATLGIAGGFVYALNCGDTGRNAAGDPYCATSIGCASGCGGGSDGADHAAASDGGGDSGGDSSGDSGSSCGSGCGGD